MTVPTFIAFERGRLARPLGALLHAPPSWPACYCCARTSRAGVAARMPCFRARAHAVELLPYLAASPRSVFVLATVHALVSEPAARRRAQSPFSLR